MTPKLLKRIAKRLTLEEAEKLYKLKLKEAERTGER